MPAPVKPYDALRRLIVRGRIAPGTRLTEPVVAERLGISRTPVREAMQRLQLEGLLVTDGGGARPRLAVAPLDANEATQVYLATGALESLAARSLHEATPAVRRTLAAELARRDAAFRAATHRGTADTMFDTHTAFHRALRDATTTPVVRELLDTLGPRLERYQWFHAPLLKRAGLAMKPAHAEHAAIVQAVRKGTADELEYTVRANWTNAADRLQRAFAL
jgi:DNA-binding GntR family transcriptional regulator